MYRSLKQNNGVILSKQIRNLAVVAAPKEKEFIPYEKTQLHTSQVRKRYLYIYIVYIKMICAYLLSWRQCIVHSYLY